MGSHRGKINSVMLGVGATFEFLAGTKPQAPEWVQASGLEWLFRLGTEPRRLFRRYAYHNPRFILLLAQQYFKLRSA
jgi:N-acetylglucosaminyldiphosphoundecaprenol N-acetyl-beta-D-mannosaminyltransferase